MTGRPTPARASSHTADHRPVQPSSLRQAHPLPGSDDGDENGSGSGDNGAGGSSNRKGDRPKTPSRQPAKETDTTASPPRGGIFTSESTPLIQGQGSDRPQGRSSVHPAHGGACGHGTFSPRPSSPATSLRDGDDDTTSSSASGTQIPVLDSAISHIVGHDDWKRWLKKRVRTKKMGHSSALAEQAGIRDTPLM